MKIVLAFDSFKGCMTQMEVCAVAENAILESYPDFEVISLPMSDGGEGLSACLAEYYSAHPVNIRVHGPLMDVIDCRYFISEDGNTAIMEMAAAAGLCLVPEGRRNPMITTTYGVGEMILDAVGRGCHHIILGIGGSATCDAGKGMVDCLASSLPLVDIRITVACDVNNPLFGTNGAAYVFGPQKGAGADDVKLLDDRLRQFAIETEALGYAKPEDALFPGAGAAGGLGYALKTYLGAELVSGIELLLEAVSFADVIKDADYVFTGEGRTDAQTKMGKVPSVILSKSRKSGIPVILLSGSVEDKESALKDGYTFVNSINEGDTRPLFELMEYSVAKENLKKTIPSVLNRL